MRSALITVAVVAAALAGCGGGDKAGGSGAPVTLRIGTDDPEGRPSGVAIEAFSRAVRELSDGQIRIQPVFNANGEDDAPAWDQRIARKVVSGELDMGMVPARAWDTEGVTSLRAVHAPLLVDSDALLARVVTSELLARELLAGLERGGVHGLALIPEGLRHPFGFRHALVGPGDYAGATVRVNRSQVAYALMREFGGHPDDPNGEVFNRGVASGAIDGAESAFAVAAGLPAKAVATANVTFFPKVESLVIGRKAWERLSGDQRTILERAAQRARDDVVRTTAPEAETARAYCAEGGRVVLATPADLAALKAAAQPIYASLERDAQTQRLIERIRALARELPAPAAPAACAPPAPRPTAPTKAQSAFPDGVYRANVSAAFLRSRGIEAGVAKGNGGLHTLTFRRGVWRDHTDSAERLADCVGSYSVSGGRVAVVCEGFELFSAAWTLRDGLLRFTDIRTHAGTHFADAMWGGMPWRKIG